MQPKLATNFVSAFVVVTWIWEGAGRGGWVEVYGGYSFDTIEMGTKIGAICVFVTVKGMVQKLHNRRCTASFFSINFNLLFKKSVDKNGMFSVKHFQLAPVA